MEYSYASRRIEFPGKELTVLDKLVLKFVAAIDFNYVIMSGYIAILFGRSRSTEDIDLFIDRLPQKKFADFCTRLEK